MKTVRGNGWFTAIVSALAAGDEDALREAGAQFDTRTFMGKKEEPHEFVARTLFSISDAGIARHYGDGWRTIDHPQIGTIGWQTSRDHFLGGTWFLLQVNDTLVFKYHISKDHGQDATWNLPDGTEISGTKLILILIGCSTSLTAPIPLPELNDSDFEAI